MTDAIGPHGEHIDHKVAGPHDHEDCGCLNPNIEHCPICGYALDGWIAVSPKGEKLHLACIRVIDGDDYYSEDPDPPDTINKEARQDVGIAFIVIAMILAFAGLIYAIVTGAL
jgi:hypothetical protein